MQRTQNMKVKIGKKRRQINAENGVNISMQWSVPCPFDNQQCTISPFTIDWHTYEITPKRRPISHNHALNYDQQSTSSMVTCVQSPPASPLSATYTARELCKRKNVMLWWAAAATVAVQLCFAIFRIRPILPSDWNVYCMSLELIAERRKRKWFPIESYRFGRNSRWESRTCVYVYAIIFNGFILWNYRLYLDKYYTELPSFFVRTVYGEAKRKQRLKTTRKSTAFTDLLTVNSLGLLVIGEQKWHLEF